ncbi:hypothetical protein Ccrd_004032 [Cynara cardunculus var. scolymus]|uniref:Uncharacterized protein n=1 Tax=Cynara cardunculus var. scolymus TaxID=59895 RepID=A0A103XNQ1_CYNCS|nr:hypothetical protein Ccrd_004032 [Cynara cardunculus var. scolymus]
MCYQNSCYSGLENLMKTRWYIPDQAPRIVVAEEDGGRGGGASHAVTNQCLCSPTSHPGSFRCRYHHNEYIWGSRVIRVTMRSR